MLYFVFGFALVILAAVCATMPKTDGVRLPWHKLALFGILIGMHEWLRLIADCFHPGYLIELPLLLLKLFGLAFLVEFGRVSLIALTGRGPRHAVTVVLALLALVLSMRGGIDAMHFVLRLVLGFTGGCVTAWALYLLSCRVTADEQRWLRIAAGASAVLGMSRLVFARLPVTLPMPSVPVFSFPLMQLLGTVLILTAAVALWGYGQTARANTDLPVAHRFHHHVLAWFVLVPLTIIGFGWVGVEQLSLRVDAGMRTLHISRVQTIASILSPAAVADLHGDASDVGRDTFQRICRQLSHFRHLNPDCRFVYLMRKRDDTLIFLADGEPSFSRDYSPPGQVYDNTSTLLQQNYSLAQPFVEGPDEDEWGHWVTGYAPIIDQRTGAVPAYIGMDIDAGMWSNMVARVRFTAITAILALCLVALILLMALQSVRESRTRIALSERRFRLMFERAPDGILIIHPLTREILAVNTALATWLGYTQDDLLVMQYDLLVDNGYQSSHNALPALGSAATTRRFRTRHGHGLDVEVTGAGVQFNGQDCLLLFVRDITERKRAEQVMSMQRDLGLALGSMTTLPDALTLCLDTALHISEMDCGGILLVDAETGSNRPAVSKGVPSHLLPLLAGLSTDVHSLAEGDTQDAPDAMTCICKEGLLALVTIAVVHETRTIAHIIVASHTRAHLPATAHAALETIASQVGNVIERLRAEDALRESETRLKTVLDAVQAGIVLIDAETHVVVDANPAAITMSGLSRASLVGKTCHETICLGSWDTCAMRESCASLINRDSTLVVAGQAPMPVLKTILPITLDGRRHLLESFIDVTDLVRARQAAEDASRAKGRFLANMSHEIRTPMNAILGFTDLVLASSLTSDQQECLQTVHTAAKALLDIINDILDFSKIEAGKLELAAAPFNLATLIDETISIFALRACQQGVELLADYRLDVPLALLGDEMRLRQVLVNLIGNALKFTERGECVLTVETAEQHGEDITLRFAVRDTGIGVPVAQQQAIFAAFAQADDSTTRRFGGTGLGLAISTQLVQLMGGTIGVDSVEGVGSTFHFTARFRRQMPVSAPDARYLPLVGMPVLVVDDHPASRDLLAARLRDWRMRPVCAESGAAAMQMVAAMQTAGAPPALAVIDAEMPELDGVALAQALRQHGLSIVLMLTATGKHPDSDDLDAAVIRKPVKCDDLLTALLQVVDGVPRVSTAPAMPAIAQVTALHVLLVEDNRINQQLALRLLQKAGHTVTVANDGIEAITAWQREPFDLILMDVQMPNMNGLEATVQIRMQEQATGRHIPIITMTAHAMDGDKEMCLAAGMDGYLTKPIDPESLHQEIARMMPLITNVSTLSAPAFAPAALLAAADDDRELALELVSLLLEDTPVQLALLRQAVQHGDAGETRRLAHGLKGAVSNFGAEEARQAAYTLELAARDGDLAAIPTALATLEDALYRLDAALRAYLNEMPAMREPAAERV